MDGKSISLQHLFGSIILITPVSLKIAMYFKSLSSSSVVTEIGMIDTIWLFRLADGIDVKINSVKFRRELDVAARQLPLKLVSIKSTLDFCESLSLLSLLFAIVAAKWANDEDVDMELSDELEQDVFGVIVEDT
jgi:hypothetical protein